MRLLDELIPTKASFGAAAAAHTAALLEQLALKRIRTTDDLIRLHETALFLRAYPQSARVARLADQILFNFSSRMRGVDPSPFDNPEMSGIAGTSLSTNYSYEFACSLLRRHADA